jgi:hypothetical protein
MNNYVNLEGYCRSCTSFEEEEDYIGPHNYYRENFQYNTKGKLIVNPSKPEDVTPVVKENFKQRQQFQREGVL